MESGEIIDSIDIDMSHGPIQPITMKLEYKTRNQTEFFSDSQPEKTKKNFLPYVTIFANCPNYATGKADNRKWRNNGVFFRCFCISKTG